MIYHFSCHWPSFFPAAEPPGDGHGTRHQVDGAAMVTNSIGCGLRRPRRTSFATARSSSCPIRGRPSLRLLGTWDAVPRLSNGFASCTVWAASTSPAGGSWWTSWNQKTRWSSTPIRKPRACLRSRLTTPAADKLRCATPRTNVTKRAIQRPIQGANHG